MRNKLFPFILASEHLELISEKDKEIARLQNIISELSKEQLNNHNTMNQEESIQMNASIESLKSKVSSLETGVSQLLTRLNDFESRISNLLNAPAASTAVAPSSVEPVATPDAPRAVLADMDIVSDFYASLEKLEAAYSN